MMTLSNSQPAFLYTICNSGKFQITRSNYQTPGIRAPSAYFQFANVSSSKLYKFRGIISQPNDLVAQVLSISFNHSFVFYQNSSYQKPDFSTTICSGKAALSYSDYQQKIASDYNSRAIGRDVIFKADSQRVTANKTRQSIIGDELKSNANPVVP